MGENNQREIKFRAWDKEHQTMVFAIPLATVNFYGGLDDFFKNTVVMQYTGLKDKNGKEIYEGDIVQGSGYDGTYYSSVIFRDCRVTIDCFRAVQVSNPPDHTMSHDRVKTYGFITHWDPNGYHTLKTGWDDIEVIGNIYENPELLSTE